MTRLTPVFVGLAQVLMSLSTAISENPERIEPTDANVAARGPSLGWVVLIATWCGLVAGLLEVAAFLVRKWGFDTNQLYGMSRDFVWLIPLTNLIIFVVLGISGWLVSRFWPGFGRRVLAIGSCALLILPATLVAFPRIHGLAWLAVALGLASRVVPILDRCAARVRKIVVFTWPLIAVAVAGLAASRWIEDRAKQVRENARPTPAAASPNILLVVMDTVGAGHLGLYGYSRPTSPTLAELAERGIRFDSARSGSSWTLPSHAIMFTGRWFHELAAGWLTPLDSAHPTLAEFLGERGYATAGFTANYTYCARDSGLARGFTHYRDYWFPLLTFSKMAALVSRSLEGLQSVENFLESELEIAQFGPCLEYARWLVDSNRKLAAQVNRELLEWLSHRENQERPFFAFLNYYDAHTPYHIPPGKPYRFWAVPDDDSKRKLLDNWLSLDKAQITPEQIEFAAGSYDECIAALDEQLGVLVDELERLGVLDRTWLFVVADHGESFGEHAGVYGHGLSLYEAEVHVPLVIVPPGGTDKHVVAAPVSLRDLAATVVDVTGMAEGSPFPGSSLAPLWGRVKPPSESPPASASPTLIEVVPLASNVPDEFGLPRTTWPLAANADGEWSYIRRDHDGHEELFDLRVDRKEQRNRAGDREAQLTLERMRANLKVLTGGPLTPERFKP